MYCINRASFSCTPRRVTSPGFKVSSSAPNASRMHHTIGHAGVGCDDLHSTLAIQTIFSGDLRSIKVTEPSAHSGGFNHSLRRVAGTSVFIKPLFVCLLSDAQLQSCLIMPSK
jgi:hypothetical protein